ncbi:MarR family transcriptional regulator [Nakamurella flava]|uniref:MarR family transcriptional regulator n=2 Tax=Nakamurella flava TaxID=2576308 RepID=A0A4U6QPX1_9ACTN|nr:MarR family transcriptional regulator [Nakamurella flava]
MQIAHRIRRSASAGLAPLQMTPAQSRALRVVARAEAPIRMGEIAARLDVVPRSATGLVEALESAGLVERTVDPANRRSVLVSLSEQGTSILREMTQARAATAEVVFGVLDPGERTQLAALLHRVVAVSDEEPAGSER